MSKDLHDIDNLFRSSLESYEETPSISVREKLEASLDKTDSESYKKRFLLWKRAAIALFFLLIGIALYEAGILRISPDYSGKNYAAKKPGHPASDDQKNEKNDIPLSDKKIDEPVTLSVKDKLDENTNVLEINTNSQTPSYNADITGVKGRDKSSGSNKAPSPKQYKHPSAAGEANLVDNPSMLHNNSNTSRINIQQNIPGEDIYAYPLLQKNNPSASITRTPFDPQIDSDAFLKNLTISENQNKNRIGFKPHWLIGAVFSYEAAGYKLDSDLPDEISNIKHREVHEPSYSGGVLITRQLTIDWGLQSGLLYSKTNIGIGPQKIYAFLDPAGDVAYKYVTSSGYVYIKPKTGSPPSFGDSIIATEGKHTLHYITVPLSVKYRAGKNKFSFVPGVGIEANFLTGTRVETEIESPSNSELVFVNKLYGANSFYWSLTADAELRYNLNKKTMLSFRPSYHHSISPITENNIVETFPYSFRWGVGLTFKL